MNLQKALAKVSASGLTLRLLAGKVKVVTTENSEPLPPKVHTWLKQNKDEVKAHLEAEEKLVRFQGTAIPIQYWQGEELGDTVAIDTETVLVPDDSPDEVPPLVLAAAYDGESLFMFGPDQAEAFLELHKNRTFIFHNARFDVRVLEKAAGDSGYLLQAIDDDRVYDSNIFEKLLNLATTGEPAVPSTKLDQCAARYFNLAVPKVWKDEDGDTIRLSYGKHFGKAPAELPPCYRSYAALDPVATWHLLQAQQKRLPKIKKAAASAYGYTTKQELEESWSKWGPLSHHIQVKADVVFGYMTDHGLGRDFNLCEQLQADLQQQMKDTEKALVEANLQPGEGSSKRLQAYMKDVAERFPDEFFAKTKTGDYVTNKDAKKKVFDLTKDPAIPALQEFDRARKWLSTYVKGMLDTAKLKLKVEWRILARSGRTTTGTKKKGTALPAQCMPKDMLDTSSKVTVRQCLRPYPATNVFIGADYSTLEVVTFASELLRLGMGSELAEVVKAGRDVHTALAAIVYGVPESEVTKEQRKSVKPFTFGIPGCMAGESLQKHAAGFGVELSLKEVEHIYEGYANFNPAITEHLAEEKLGSRVARLIGARTDNQAWGFLGVIAGEKKWGRSPNPAREWRSAYRVAEAVDVSDTQREKVVSLIKQRAGSRYLFNFFRGLASKYSQLSPTGRLRANADFRPTRNGLFQSVASDGGLLACWALFRKGFKPIAFVHDEIVAVTPRDGTEFEQCEALGEVMVEVMADLLQLPVKVEPFVRNSFSPKDDIAKPPAEPLPPADAFCKKPEVDDDFAMAVGEDDDDDDFAMGVATPKKRQRKVDQCTDRFTAKLISDSFDDGDLPF